MLSISINGQKCTTNSDGDMPLLWFLRDELKLTATKFGCGVGQCGACTVHLDGQATRSCMLPISAIGSANVTTMEGEHSKQMIALKEQWQSNNIPQCGYCQVGQLMNASALLKQQQQPSDEQIEVAMSGNICRCGTYERIKVGIQQAGNILANKAR